MGKTKISRVYSKGTKQGSVHNSVFFNFVTFDRAHSISRNDFTAFPELIFSCFSV